MKIDERDKLYRYLNKAENWNYIFVRHKIKNIYTYTPPAYTHIYIYISIPRLAVRTRNPQSPRREERSWRWVADEKHWSRRAPYWYNSNSSSQPNCLNQEPPPHSPPPSFSSLRRTPSATGQPPPQTLQTSPSKNCLLATSFLAFNFQPNTND